jgi:VWFA-related protein
MKYGLKLNLSLALAAVVLAQAPQPKGSSTPASAPKESAPAGFSSHVNLVSIPAIVHDKDGHTVGTLKVDDFQIQDKGKTQVITKFLIEKNLVPADVAAIPSAAGDRTTTPAKNGPLQTGEPVLPSRFVAYFFDDLHMKVQDFLRAQDAANRQLERTLDPNTRAAVFTSSERVFLDFTDDRAALHTAINRIQMGSHGSIKNTDCPPLTQFLADYIVNKVGTLTPITANAPNVYVRAVAAETYACLNFPLPVATRGAAPAITPQQAEQIQTTAWHAALSTLAETSYESVNAMNAISSLIETMSYLPGTRTIVMVSPGFLLTGEQRATENTIFEKAIRAKVGINTLDVRGLYTVGAPDASDVEPGAGASQLVDSVGIQQAVIAEAAQDGQLLDEIAAGTGGFYVHNSNDLEKGLDQLAARPEYVYVLGYSPDNLKNDGSYHSINVKIKNGAKFEVQARRGYTAPRQKDSPAEQNREEIRDATFSRDELDAIPMKLNTGFFLESDTKAQLTVRTWVEGKTLKFSKGDDRNLESLTIAFNVFNLNGRLISGVQRRFELKFEDALLESVRTTGLAVREDFEISPGSYVVRVVVRDGNGKTMAAHNQGVQIQ